MSPVAAWLTATVLTLEGPEQSLVTAAVAGHRRVAAGQLLAVLAWCAALATVSVVAGSLVRRPLDLATLLVGLVAHGCCAGQGIGLTVLSSRHLWRSMVVAVTVAGGLQVVALVVPVSASRVVAAALSGPDGVDGLTALLVCSAGVMVVVLAAPVLLGTGRTLPATQAGR